MEKYTQIKEQFEKYKDKEKADKMAKYMKNKFEFYGIPTPLRKNIYKELLKKEKNIPTIDWQLLDQCFQDEHREFQYFVIDYLKIKNKFIAFEDVEKIKKYIQTKEWWDTIDGFDAIIGNILDPRLDDLMLQWSKDDDFWLRRIAIDHQLSRKDQTNEDLLKQIIINNLGSDEFFINKAIGWSLREYSKTNASWVENFIKEYDHQMSSLSIKEASKYLNGFSSN